MGSSVGYISLFEYLGTLLDIKIPYIILDSAHIYSHSNVFIVYVNTVVENSCKWLVLVGTFKSNLKFKYLLGGKASSICANILY